MSGTEATAVLTRAQRSLEEQRFEEARAAIVEGRARFPQNAKVRDLYEQIHLADGVRRHRVARDLRRDEIQSLKKRERAGYRNSERVTRAFQEALASLDKVLDLAPKHAKAMMLKAGILDRMDREASREEVGRLLADALALHPGNEELAFARDRLASSCPHCQDTGLCPDCQGAGELSALFLKNPCPTCKGKGICPRCGLF